MTTGKNERSNNFFEEVAAIAGEFLNFYGITRFDGSRYLLEYEPDLATLTVTDKLTGKPALSAVWDGDGWLDCGSPITPEMLGHFKQAYLNLKLQSERNSQPPSHQLERGF